MSAGSAPAPQPRSQLDGFLSHLAHERRLSPHTVEAYAHDVRSLLELAGETPLPQIEVHQARRMVAQLHARGLGGKSLARMLSAWRSFFRYLARDHGSDQEPVPGPARSALGQDAAQGTVSGRGSAAAAQIRG